MDGSELAGERIGARLSRRVTRALGPAGVFFQGFLEQPRMVGSIIPSSSHTIRKMLAPVRWDECKVFVEYGPGVGTFCRPVLGSAADVEEILAALGHEKADYVLSGLPFSTLPEGVGPAIAAATHRVVRKGGAFLTYQFSTVARDLTARHFGRVDTGFAWWNIPPCLLAWGWQTD